LELDLTIDQIAEVAVVGEQIERHQAATAESLLGGMG